ncbi:cupin domain-containing protein [Chryseobacterium sp. WG14]|uniref:cupin domain-containing protein n=1 Tax=unclassified Chryseobacterium TaxID=2593645 RepID=UPI00211DCCEC|nr:MULTISPECIES: cupin domain-containing protein [unclassified Chryseobacterium]MCQ9634803.1 cupin domain-containing protein [Chryseobacterium sp. WG23]MCQ9640089.1 cupin domain-containing protein [Chryseobacterium sp. WG14]
METFNTTIFPKGEKAPSDYFFGGTAWIHLLKPNEDGLNCQVGNVTFEPRCRNNWHSHGGGQILIVTSGKGFYQEKGKHAQVLHPGDVVNIPPDVIHWHGAAPDSELTHIAINVNTQNGIVEWLKPVTNDEYNNL